MCSHYRATAGQDHPGSGPVGQHYQGALFAHVSYLRVSAIKSCTSTACYDDRLHGKSLYMQVATLAWTQGSNSSNWPDVRPSALTQHGSPNTCEVSCCAAGMTVKCQWIPGVDAQDYKDFLNDSSLVAVLTEAFQIGPNPGLMAHAVSSLVACQTGSCILHCGCRRSWVGWYALNGCCIVVTTFWLLFHRACCETSNLLQMQP